MPDIATARLGTAVHLPTTADTPRPTLLPSKVGPYQIVREVGRGGMGIVYEAFDPRLRRRAAVKMPLACPLPDVLPRFQTEAEAMAQLAHPHIVGIYDVGQHDGLPFVAFEFLPGDSLQTRTRGKPQPPRQAADLIHTLAGAVHHAHQHGVVHRDLKPANILFAADGQPKVTDFGVARLISGLPPEAPLTQVGQVVGTPQFMAPEQALGLPGGADPAVDVYALGAILYQMLTGRPPHDGPDSMSVLTAVACHDPAPPRRLVPSLPRDLETICLTALERTPARRYRSAEALADDLGRFLAGEPILAQPDGFARRTLKKARRRPLVAGLLAALGIVMAAGLYGMAWQWRRAVTAADAALAHAHAATAARADAEAARDAATAEKANAEEQKANAVAQATKAEQGFYDARLAGTTRLIETGDWEQALEELENPPERGWEWHHLQRLAKPFIWRKEAGAGWPQAAAVSPDGTRVAVCSGDPYANNFSWDSDQPAGLEVRNLATGRQVGVPVYVLKHRVDHLAWLDDRRVVAMDRWGNVAVAAVGTGEPFVLTDSRPLVFGGRFPAGYGRLSPDGRWAVRGSDRGGLTVLRPGDPGTPPRTFRFDHPVTPMDVHRDGLAAVREWHAPGRSDLLVVDLATGDVRFRLPDIGQQAGFAADGRRLAVMRGEFGRRGLGVWDTQSGLPVWERAVPADEFDMRLTFTPDDRHLIELRHPSNRVRVWDAVAGAVRFDLVGHTNRVVQVQPAPDGRTLATAGNDASVRLWSLTDGRQLAALFGHRNGVRALAFAPDAARLVSGGMDGHIAAWDLTLGGGDGGELPPLDLDEGPRYLTSARFGGLWATADGAGWRLDTHTAVLQRFDPAGFVPGRRVRLDGLGRRETAFHNHFDLSPDGTRLLGRASPTELAEWDTATGKKLPTPPGPVESGGVAYSRDGTLAAAVGPIRAAGGMYGRLIVWEVATHKVVMQRDRVSNAGVAFLPDGRLALGMSTPVGMAGGAMLVDPRTGADQHLAGPDNTHVASLAVSADGRRVAGLDSRPLSRTGGVRVLMWDVPTGRPLWVKDGKGGRSGLAFSPDGSRLAVARYDDRVEVWRADTGDTVLVKAPPSERLGDSFFPARAAFTADGKRLIANHADGRLSVWSADSAADRAAESERAVYGFHLRALGQLAGDPRSVGFRLHAERLGKLVPPSERCRELAEDLARSPTR